MDEPEPRPLRRQQVAGFIHHRERFDVFPQRGASPVGADEKSSLNWMFSRLSLSRFMSYLPLLSFGPSAIVSGSAYLLSPPFGMECLTSLDFHGAESP